MIQRLRATALRWHPPHQPHVSPGSPSRQRHPGNPSAPRFNLLRPSGPVRRQTAADSRAFVTSRALPRRKYQDGGRSGSSNGSNSSTTIIPAGEALRSGTSGILTAAFFMSIAFVLPDWTLDWDSRQRAAIELINSVTLEDDDEVRTRRFFDLGASLLASYAKNAEGRPRGVGDGEGDEEEEDQEEVEEVVGLAGAAATAALVTRHGSLVLGRESEWRDHVVTEVYSVDDPDALRKPGESGRDKFVVCMIALKRAEGGGDVEEDYVTVHGNLLTDVTEDIIPAFDELGKRIGINRGAILVLAPSCEWKSVYFDGRRYISVGFLEWQTAETMGFVR